MEDDGPLFETPMKGATMAPDVEGEVIPESGVLEREIATLEHRLLVWKRILLGLLLLGVASFSLILITTFHHHHYHHHDNSDESDDSDDRMELPHVVPIDERHMLSREECEGHHHRWVMWGGEGMCSNVCPPKYKLSRRVRACVLRRRFLRHYKRGLHGLQEEEKGEKGEDRGEVMVVEPEEPRGDIPSSNPIPDPRREDQMHHEHHHRHHQKHHNKHHEHHGQHQKHHNEHHHNEHHQKHHNEHHEHHHEHHGYHHKHRYGENHHHHHEHHHHHHHGWHFLHHISRFARCLNVMVLLAIIVAGVKVSLLRKEVCLKKQMQTAMAVPPVTMVVVEGVAAPVN